MFKSLKAVLLMTIFVLAIASTSVSIMAQAEEHGPPLDKIIVDVRLSQDVGLGDVAAGRTDIFMWGVSPATLERLPPEVKENIKLAVSRSGYWSYVFNPAYTPELGPGVLNTTAGEVHFNPFAIRKVRFAMNYVINRKFLIDNILLGGGEAMFTPIFPANPFHELVEDLIEEYNLTPEGNLELGLKMIDEALAKVAADLEANTDYRLFKVEDPEAPAGYWWHFSGPGVPGGEEVVTAKFVIRIEDERHEAGLAVARWIEQAGIKVERLEWDRRRAIRTVYLTNPRDFQWSIYTEGWITLSDFPYVEFDFSFFYSPLHGFVPAYPISEWLVYRNESIERLADKIETGAIPSPEDYVTTIKSIARLGLLESVRVFAVNTIEYWAYNPRVSNMVTGFITGPATFWPYRTATTPDGVFRVTEYSAQGALFLTVWNPVLGFTGYYAEIIRYAVTDFGSFTHPATGEPSPVRLEWEVEKGFEVNETTLELIPTIDVPPSAMVYDPVSEKWVSVGTGKKAIAKVTYHYKFSNWHHGLPMSMADVLATLGFYYEWANEDFEGDPFYDSSFAADIAPWLASIVGVEVVDEDTLVVYGNYYHPYSDNVIADYLSIWPTLPWEVWTAMEYVCVEGGPKTGTPYWWETIEEYEGLDLITKSHTEDMIEALRILTDQGWTVTVGENVVRDVPAPYISPYIPEGMVSADEATARMAAAIDFGTRFGHLYISNGPFFIKSYNPEERFMELDAFRDPTYPFTKTYWQEKLVVASMRIDGIVVPAEREQGQSFKVDILLSYTQTYPEVIDEPATFGDVTVKLIAPDGTVVFSGKANLVSAGLFSIVIPDYITLDLSPGIYRIQVFASIGGLWGVTAEASIVIKERAISELARRLEDVSARLEGVSAAVADAFQELSGALQELSGKLDSLAKTLSGDISGVQDTIRTQTSELSDSISGLAGAINMVAGLVVVAIILSLVSIVLVVRK